MVPIGAFLIFFTLWNGLPLFLGLLLMCLVVCYEMFSLMEKRGYKFYIWANSAAITLSFLNYYLFGLGTYDMGYFFVILIAIMTLLCLLIIIIESTSGKFESSMENIGISVFGFIMLGIFSPMILLLKMMDMTGWVLAVALSITWLTDTGGLIFGKVFGKHKIRYLSSPNKTVEGYIGAYLFGFITAAVLYFMQGIFNFTINYSIIQMFILSLFVITASIIGDLGESTIKRWANTKDSSDLLPGHGGFFDRFDSIIFSAPVYFVIIKLFGY
jgi:phosphatidate cytidylyltransferase